MAIGSGKSVIVVGAGLVGSLAAIYLSRLGYRVRVFERRGDPRRAGYIGGRSINLALSARGLWGLAGVGLDGDVLRRALPMRGRMIHPPLRGAPTVFQSYSARPGDAINSISRGGLNMALLDACEREASIELAFNRRCVEVELDEPGAVFKDDSPGGDDALIEEHADLVLGADGAFSPVRLRLQRSDRFDYSQSYLEHGYKELHIPPSKAGEFAMDPSALHIWPRTSAMMIALPNLDKSFTCTLFWPFDGEHSFAKLRTPDQVRTFFDQHYPDVPAMMPTLEDDYVNNPVSSLVTVRCWPWSHVAPGGRGVVLLGDAAHAIVPFFGQGMNSGFEDCRVLAACLERSGGALSPALGEYQRLRKPNADAIAQMALDNFVEMRDKVGTPEFLRRKKIEHMLHEWFPDRCVPKYNLVSFSTEPYAEALRQGTRLDRLLDQLERIPNTSGDNEWTTSIRREADRLLREAPG
jgi:kynurenine 3-monooxygenase